MLVWACKTEYKTSSYNKKLTLFIWAQMAAFPQCNSKNLFCMKSLSSNCKERRIHHPCITQSQVHRALLEMNVGMEVGSRGSEFIQKSHRSSWVNEIPLPFVLWISVKASVQHRAKRKGNKRLAESICQSSRKLDSTLTSSSITRYTMPKSTRKRLICRENVVSKFLLHSVRQRVSYYFKASTT